jgi:hypothetical protein
MTKLSRDVDVRSVADELALPGNFLAKLTRTRVSPETFLMTVIHLYSRAPVTVYHISAAKGQAFTVNVARLLIYLSSALHCSPAAASNVLLRFCKRMKLQSSKVSLIDSPERHVITVS